MANNTLLPKRGRPSRTKLMDWTAIPLRKRLEVLFMSEVIKERKLLSRRVDLPLGVIDMVLSYRHSIMLDWKHSPYSDGSLATVQLENIAAINEILAEWRLRLLALAFDVTDAMLCKKAETIVAVCRVEKFELTKLWLRKCKTNTHTVQMDPRGTCSLLLSDIIEDLKDIMPYRIYINFLLNATVATTNNPLVDAIPDANPPTKAADEPDTPDAAGAGGGDSDVEIIEMPVDTIDMTVDDGHRSWSATAAAAASTPKAKRYCEAANPNAKPKAKPKQRQRRAKPNEIHRVGNDKRVPVEGTELAALSSPIATVEAGTRPEDASTIGDDSVEVLAIVDSDGEDIGEVAKALRLRDEVDAVSYVSVLSNEIAASDQAEEDLGGDVLGFMQGRLSPSVPASTAQRCERRAAAPDLRGTHYVARACLLKLADFLAKRYDPLGAAAVRQLAATFEPAGQ